MSAIDPRWRRLRRCILVNPRNWIIMLRAWRGPTNATDATGETLLRRAEYGGRKGRRAAKRIARGEFR